MTELITGYRHLLPRVPHLSAIALANRAFLRLFFSSISRCSSWRTSQRDFSCLGSKRNIKMNSLKRQPHYPSPCNLRPLSIKFNQADHVHFLSKFLLKEIHPSAAHYFVLIGTKALIWRGLHKLDLWNAFYVYNLGTHKLKARVLWHFLRSTKTFV